MLDVGELIVQSENFLDIKNNIATRTERVRTYYMRSTIIINTYEQT